MANPDSGPVATGPVASGAVGGSRAAAAPALATGPVASGPVASGAVSSGSAAPPALATGSLGLGAVASGTVAGGTASSPVVAPVVTRGPGPKVLVWSAAKNAWCPTDLCTLVAACLTPGFGAVAFTGTVNGWNFPVMSDSPTGSLSVWLYMAQAQQHGFGAPWTPVGGDLFNKDETNTSIIIDKGPNLSMYLQVGAVLGVSGPPLVTNPPTSGGNTITNVTATNPAVWTFASPHGIAENSVLHRVAVTLGTNDANYFPTSSPSATYLQVSAVTPTTITVNYDASAAIGGFTPITKFTFLVLNSLTLWLSNAGGTSTYQWMTGTAMPQDQWVNLLMSWDTNHASGTKIVTCYYGETQVSSSAVYDAAGAFNINYSDTQSGGEGLSWTVGFGDTGELLCYMAEMWFAPGQFIDFTNSANRAKFHDLGTGAPVSLGVTGALPTGTVPTLYLTEPVSGLSNTMPVAAIDPSAHAGAFVGGNQAFLQINATPLANGITTSTSLVFSMWVDRHTVGAIWTSPDTEIDLDGKKCTVTLGGMAGAFIFNFPYSAGDGVNIRCAVDMNHPVGSKIALAYVGTSSAAVTVTLDIGDNAPADWTAGPLSALFYSVGYIGDLWIAPDQFFDPVNDFIDISGNPVNLGATGNGTSFGVAPSIYFHISSTDPASAFATNRGTGGAFSILPLGIGSLSLQSATGFLRNAAGTGPLNIQSGAFDFEIAPSHP